MAADDDLDEPDEAPAESGGDVVTSREKG
jgi:hypothetical protein